MISFESTRTKIASLITVVCFSITTTVWGLPVTVDVPATVSDSIKHIEIPEELASVEQTFQGHVANRPLVIHIQNAHAHAESQFQIRAILRYLHEKLGMRLALVEGAVNQLDPSLLQFFPDPGLNVKVNEQLALQGMVSGVQLFLLESNDQMKVFGIEDAKLYRENLANFREVMRDESTIQKFLMEGHAILTHLEKKVFDRDLGEFVAKRKAFKERRLDIVAFTDTLRMMAGRYLKIDLNRPQSQYEWPALVRLVILKNIEEIDKGLLDAEYKRLETRLAQDGVPEELRGKLSELKARSVEKKEARFDAAEPRFLVEQIYLKSNTRDLPIAEYPQVANWLAREILGSELDGGELMSEIEHLSNLLLGHLASEPLEQNLLELMDDFDLLGSALNLELTGEQFDVFTRRKSQLRFESLRERLTELQTEAGVPPTVLKEIDQSPEKINQLLESANRFYLHAQLRDDAMVRKTSEIITRENAGVVALITGGFHTQGILRELKESDISYMAITPRLTGNLNLDRTNYISHLMNTKPNIFARAHLDAIQLSQSRIREIFAQMDPDHEGGAPEAVMEFATGLLASVGTLKVPVNQLESFRSNELLPLTITVSPDKRWVMVRGWGREAKLPVGVGGILDEHSLHGAITTLLAQEKPVETARIEEAEKTAAVIDEAEKIVSGRAPEEEFRDVLSRLSLHESLARVDRAVLEKLHEALEAVQSAPGAQARLQAINQIPPILVEISSGASGTLALRGLANRISALVAWAVLAESNFPEALADFLGVPVLVDIEKPAESMQAISAPEILEPATTGFGAVEGIINLERVYPQTRLGFVKGVEQILDGLQVLTPDGGVDETGLQEALSERQKPFAASRVRGLMEALGREVAPSDTDGLLDMLWQVLASIFTGEVDRADLPAAAFLLEETSRVIELPSLERRFPIVGSGVLNIVFFVSPMTSPTHGVRLAKSGTGRDPLVMITPLARTGEKLVPLKNIQPLGLGRSVRISKEISLALSPVGEELVVTGPALTLVERASGFGLENDVPSAFVAEEVLTKIVAVGVDSPELLTRAVKPPAIPAAPQLPDLTRFSIDELLGRIFEEFESTAAAGTITPEDLVRMKLRIAEQAARGIVKPDRFLMEISRRGGIDFNIGGEGVPVADTETSMGTAIPTFTEGMGSAQLEALARSGGIAVIYDATKGITPGKEDVKAVLAQLKEAAISNLKVAIVVRVSDITQKDHETMIHRVARDLGLDAKQYKVITATNETEFAKKISNLPNMLAGYVTERERREHVTFIVPETLREEVSDYIPDGVRAIFHNIDSNAVGADVLHYWLDAGAALYSVLSKELDDARVRTVHEPFEPDPQRPTFFSFSATKALGAQLKTTYLLMQRILTSV